MQLKVQIAGALAVAAACVAPSRALGQVTTYGQDAVSETRFATEPFQQGYGMDKVPMQHATTRTSDNDYGQDANMSGRFETQRPSESAPSGNSSSANGAGEPSNE